jgi:hypothetical protein
MVACFLQFDELVGFAAAGVGYWPWWKVEMEVLPFLTIAYSPGGRGVSSVAQVSKEPVSYDPGAEKPQPPKS